MVGEGVGVEWVVNSFEIDLVSCLGIEILIWVVVGMMFSVVWMIFLMVWLGNMFKVCFVMVEDIVNVSLYVFFLCVKVKVLRWFKIFWSLVVIDFIVRVWFLVVCVLIDCCFFIKVFWWIFLILLVVYLVFGCVGVVFWLWGVKLVKNVWIWGVVFVMGLIY